MIYLVIYLTVGFIWGLYRTSNELKRLEKVISISAKEWTYWEKLTSYMLVITVVMLQSILFFPFQMYLTLRGRYYQNKLNKEKRHERKIK